MHQAHNNSSAHNCDPILHIMSHCPSSFRGHDCKPPSSLSLLLLRGSCAANVPSRHTCQGARLGLCSLAASPVKAIQPAYHMHQAARMHELSVPRYSTTPQQLGSVPVAKTGGMCSVATGNTTYRIPQQHQEPIGWPKWKIGAATVGGLLALLLTAALALLLLRHRKQKQLLPLQVGLVGNLWCTAWCTVALVRKLITASISIAWRTDAALK